jgi:hypothetical protein
MAFFSDSSIGAISSSKYRRAKDDWRVTSPVIRPLAKVANDRHNLAQIARNCRYQQLN